MNHEYVVGDLSCGGRDVWNVDVTADKLLCLVDTSALSGPWDLAHVISLLLLCSRLALTLKEKFPRPQLFRGVPRAQPPENILKKFWAVSLSSHFLQSQSQAWVGWVGP